MTCPLASTRVTAASNCGWRLRYWAWMSQRGTPPGFALISRLRSAETLPVREERPARTAGAGNRMPGRGECQGEWEWAAGREGAGDLAWRARDAGRGRLGHRRRGGIK